MPKYKYNYLKVCEKGPYGRIICRMDVNHLNKRGINAEWDKLDKKYPPSAFASCLESTQVEMECFELDPKDYI